AAVTLDGSDADGNPLTYAVVTGPSHGALSGTGADRTYTPDPDYYGPDSLTYRVNDGYGDSDVATVSITVNPVNDAPALGPVGNLILEAGVGAQTVPLTGISAGPANEAGQAVTVSAVTDNPSLVPNPTVGAVSGGSATLTFTPAVAAGTATITV